MKGKKKKMHVSPQAEWNLCSYLVDRMNKLMPMCKAVMKETQVKSLNNTGGSKNIPTIELMNGKKIYITHHRVCYSGYYNSPSTLMLINMIAFSVDEGKQYFDVFKEQKSGKNYYFYEIDKYSFYELSNNNLMGVYYKNLSIVNFMSVVSELVVEDLVTAE